MNEKLWLIVRRGLPGPVKGGKERECVRRFHKNPNVASGRVTSITVYTKFHFKHVKADLCSVLGSALLCSPAVCVNYFNTAPVPRMTLGIVLVAINRPLFIFFPDTQNTQNIMESHSGCSRLTSTFRFYSHFFFHFYIRPHLLPRLRIPPRPHLLPCPLIPPRLLLLPLPQEQQQWRRRRWRRLIASGLS